MGVHVNNRYQNIFGWFTISVLIGLTVTLFVASFF